MIRRLCLLLLALCCLPAAASAAAHTQWFAIYLGDVHIGHLQRTRTQDAEVIETRSELSLVLERSGEQLKVRSSELHRERADGTPLAFSSRFESGGTLSEVHGKVVDGEIRAEVIQGDRHSEGRSPWPPGALLADGQRRALLDMLTSRRGFAEVLAFDPSALKAMPLYSEQLGTQSRPLAGLPGTGPDLLRVRQIHGQRDGGMRSELWLDPESGEVQQMRLPALGLELLLRACSQDCATAPPQAADILASTLLPAPRALSRRDLAAPLWFLFDAGDAVLTPLESIPGQRLVADGAGRLRLRIDPRGGDSRPPTPADTQPGRWVQSDDQAVIEMARDAVGRTRHAGRKMQRLERVVRQHIRSKSLRVGYASAAEVIALREGDCTEHAVLLAALARAQGIPARVVTGLAYSPHYAGRGDVFVPHAWVMAWVDDRWVGFDAALPAFGAAHIGLSMGGGEPFDFYGGLELMGRLRLLDIAPGSTGAAE